MRIGHGYDVHKMVGGRKCVLCGVVIPFSKGPLGHSDADVPVHALMDAILGAAALGDIGRHFPDSDDRYKDADSIAMLIETVALVREKGYSVGNADITIIAQRPRLSQYIDSMREKLAEALGVDIDAVNVKATTEEGLGFTGTGEAIAAHAVVLLN